MSFCLEKEKKWQVATYGCKWLPLFVNVILESICMVLIHLGIISCHGLGMVVI